MNENNIINSITKELFRIAEQENEVTLKLTQNEWGFFYMPELAFAYVCGKSIISNKKNILGFDSYKWIRETKAFGATGPIDLVFMTDNKDLPQILIEFKLNDKDYKYLSDIEKLSKIDLKPSIKLFCSFKHVYKNQYHSFLRKQESDYSGMAELFLDKEIKTQMPSAQDDYILFSMWRVH